jgi:transcriptional regulator with XRE-family HTH domain
MRMNQDERRFDFHGLGLALKQAREEKGWTQAYVVELVGKTDRTIMNIENKGQHPSFNLFFKLVALFDISVDQFFYTEGQRGENSCRKHIDVLLSSMNEKELVVMEATAEGLKKARETEVPE